MAATAVQNTVISKFSKDLGLDLTGFLNLSGLAQRLFLTNHTGFCLGT